MSKGFAVWLTGLPGSGKSVTAEKLEELLKRDDINAYILKMDSMRKHVTPDPQYTDEERQLVYNAFSYAASLLTDHRVNVIMDATGNLRKYRALAKELINNFMMVYLSCPLKVAIEREIERKDTKEAPEEVYEKALQGESETVPGLQSEYEPPEHPDLEVNTNKLSVEEVAREIKQEITKRFRKEKRE